MACYHHMAFDICPGQPEQAWAWLSDALKLAQSHNPYLTDDGAALLDLGKYTSQTGYRAQDGLQYLFAYRAHGYPHGDMAAVYAAEIYQKSNQPEQAKKHLRIVLSENPDNSQAKKMAEALNLSQ